jgi:hypothetical protein
MRGLALAALAMTAIVATGGEVAPARGGGEATRDGGEATRDGGEATRGAGAVRPRSGASLRTSVDISRLSRHNPSLVRITARGWARRVASARRYAATRPGTIAFAVRTAARVRGHDLDRSFPSTSVVKAMLLVAYARSARDRPLREDEKALLGPMIRASDDDAANAIFVRVGTGGLQRLARAARMTRFAPASPIWGNSQITARDQTRFFLRIEELLPRRHRVYGLRLLRTIVPSQRWGVGALRLRGWRVHFKGGWGSGTGRIDHQVALLTRNQQRLAVAVLTAGNGSHAAGQETLEGVFRRLLRGL